MTVTNFNVTYLFLQDIFQNIRLIKKEMYTCQWFLQTKPPKHLLMILCYLKHFQILEEKYVYSFFWGWLCFLYQRFHSLFFPCIFGFLFATYKNCFHYVTLIA